MRDIPIRGDVIRLGQLLKHAGLADSGGEARAMLEAGLVTVGGAPETRRGRQLRAGDVVAVGGDEVRVQGPAAASQAPEGPARGGRAPDAGAT